MRIRKSYLILLFVALLIVISYGLYSRFPSAISNVVCKVRLTSQTSECFNGKEVRKGTVLLSFYKDTPQEKIDVILSGTKDTKAQYDKFLDFYIISSENKSVKELIDYFSSQPEVFNVAPDQKVKLNL